MTRGYTTFDIPFETDGPGALKMSIDFGADFHDDFMQIRLIFIPYQTRSTYSNPIQQNCLRKQTIKPIIEAKNLYHVRLKLDFTAVRYS